MAQSDPVDQPASPSKTQRKRASAELQALGEELTLLSIEQLEQFQLPEPLLDAVLAARRIAKFGARRRQHQYIGRLMHEVDAGAIAARLDALRGKSREANAYLHRLERWRERLLTDDTAFAELVHRYSDADSQRLRQLVRTARLEQEQSRPPRASRALFQALKALIPERE
ncbi:MAG: hypothetical protein C5B46_06995 [Proteobacteria bacterium]|nr:MAG: hypothetical protein C5B46_06995 [Pseudomonadota bacterium]